MIRARRDERGYMSLALALTITVLVAAAAVAIDLGAQWYGCVRLDGDVETAHEELLQPGREFLVYNSEDPAGKLAELVVDSLRAKGVEGEVDVWYWEPALGTTWTTDLHGGFSGSFGQLRRGIAYGIYCSGTRDVVVDLGQGSTSTSAAAKFYVKDTYSDNGVWTPSATSAEGTGIAMHYWSASAGSPLQAARVATSKTGSLASAMSAFGGSADGVMSSAVVAKRMEQAVADALWKIK